VSPFPFFLFRTFLRPNDANIENEGKVRCRRLFFPGWSSSLRTDRCGLGDLSLFLASSDGIAGGISITDWPPPPPLPPTPPRRAADSDRAERPIGLDGLCSSPFSFPLCADGADAGSRQHRVPSSLASARQAGNDCLRPPFLFFFSSLGVFHRGSTSHIEQASRDRRPRPLDAHIVPYAARFRRCASCRTRTLFFFPLPLRGPLSQMCPQRQKLRRIGTPSPIGQPMSNRRSIAPLLLPFIVASERTDPSPSPFDAREISRPKASRLRRARQSFFLFPPELHPRPMLRTLSGIVTDSFGPHGGFPVYSPDSHAPPFFFSSHGYLQSGATKPALNRKACWRDDV